MRKSGYLSALLAGGALLALSGNGNAAVKLSGNTNRARISTFAQGETVELIFKATGLTRKDMKLNVNIVDEYDRSIKKMEFAVHPAADGSWTRTVAIPSSRLGFYRVNAKLSDGTSPEQLYSRPKGFFTFAVVPDPARRKLYPSRDTFFGMQGGFNRKANILPYLGVRWVMGPGSWKNTERDYPGQIIDKRKAAEAKGKIYMRNVFDWCKYKVDGKEKLWTTYFFCNSLGSCCLPQNWRDGYPRPYSKISMSRAVLSPAGEKYFTNYCRELARTIAKAWPDRDEHIYEITWEPDLFNPGTLKDIVRYYELAYPAIHKEDPKAMIIGPCAGIKEAKKMMHLGLGKYLDGFSFHYTFNGAEPEKRNVVQGIRELKSFLRKAVGKDLPIMCTESGRTTDGTALNELKVAQEEIRSNLIQLGEGVRFHVAFYSADISSSGSYGYYYNLNSRIKCGSDKLSPKPIAPAYAAMTYFCEGRRGAGAIEWLGDSALGYALERCNDKNDILLALWDYGDKPITVSLLVGKGKIEVFDWMGNPLKANVKNGMLKLSLGNSPIYVRGVAPELWGRDAVRPVKLQNAVLNSFPGSEVIVRGKVTAALGKAVNGDLKLTVGTGLEAAKTTIPARLKIGESMDFAFKIKVKEYADMGNYPVSVSLFDKGNGIASGGCVIKVREPLNVLNIRPITALDGTKSLAVSIQEVQNRDVSGRIKIRIPGVPESSKLVSFSLAPGEKKDIMVDLGKLLCTPESRYKVNARIMMNSGYTFNKTATLNFMAIPRFAASPVIDGRLDDWKNIPVIRLGKDNCRRSLRYYSGDTAEVRYGWDEKALYLAVAVKDNIDMHNRKGSITWMDDCLQCGFNVDPHKEAVKSADPNAVSASQPRYYSITLAMTPNGPEAYCCDSYRQDLLRKGQIDIRKLPLKVLREKGVTCYEAAIPWSLLGLKSAPVDGQLISVDMSINDRDSKKQYDPSGMYLFEGINHPDIKNFGILSLRK